MLVTVKRFVIGAKCPPGLDSLNAYCPAMFCMKSPFWKLNCAVICPPVESGSPGTLELTMPPIDMPAWPSVRLTCCTSQSLASITPLVLASRNFCTTTVSPLVRPVTCNVMVPLYVLLTADGVTLKTTAAAVDSSCWHAATASRRIQELRVFAFMRLLALLLMVCLLTAAAGGPGWCWGWLGVLVALLESGDDKAAQLLK